jgi:hypothetical protein
MLSYLGESSVTSTNLMVGEPYQKLLTTREWASEVYVVPPTGESIPKNLKKVVQEGGMAKDESDARFLLAHDETNTSGVYRVVFSGEQNVPGVTERTENFAVNVDTVKESDMTKLVEVELQEAMAALEPKPTITHYSEMKRDMAKGGDDTGGREFWKYFIIAVLVLLGLESILAQRFGKHAT